MKRLSAALCVLVLAAGCRGGTMAGLPGSSNAEPLGSSAQSAASLSGPAAHERVMRFGAVGSSNTVTADMPVPRPDTKPCSVMLFKRIPFKNFSNHPFSYTPPAGCPGPWAKVVMNFNVSTDRGVQFDRTGIIWVGGAVVYFGTTAEPSPQLAPHWHTERDVTDESAVFKQPAMGQVSLGNCFCPPNYTGVLYGKAWLQFYPANKKYYAPRVPDVVLGIPYSPPLGNATTLPTSQMYIQTPLPQNIIHADLDLFLQSQANEEQWFMCVPTNVWNASDNALGFCPNTGFREGQVAIDGMPAGIAPIYPWIYTGGLDPYLWFPIPGVQTLAFDPYRVDLTPFAGYLSNGRSPVISVGVYNSFDHFTGAGNLLLYLDPKMRTVTGSVTRNTLAATPNQRIANGIHYYGQKGLFGGPTAKGPVTVSSMQHFTISGYVNTSIGKIVTTVTQSVSFVNAQNYNYTPTSYGSVMTMNSQLRSDVTTVMGSSRSTTSSSYDYPLQVVYPISPLKKGGYQLPIAIYQGYDKTVNASGPGGVVPEPPSSHLQNTVTAKDTMIFDSSFNWIGVANGASSQLYTYYDSTGTCYGKALVSKNNVLTAEKTPGCHAQPPPPPKP